MVLLIDTNIILDYLLKREPFYNNAKAVMEKCCLDDFHGYIALHTVTTLWYIMRRIPDDTRRLALKSLCEMLTVAGTTHEEVIAALDNAKFKDFEDCILTKCAKTVNADYIVTRNKPDFMFSEITAVSPEELIELF